MSSYKKKKRVVVAMSGGVDSSVAAGLLAEDGYEVVGVTMRLFAAKNESFAKLNKSCCSIEDVEDARKVCRQINAKHYFLNFEIHCFPLWFFLPQTSQLLFLKLI